MVPIHTVVYMCVPVSWSHLCYSAVSGAVDWCLHRYVGHRETNRHLERRTRRGSHWTSCPPCCSCMRLAMGRPCVSFWSCRWHSAPRSWSSALPLLEGVPPLSCMHPLHSLTYSCRSDRVGLSAIASHFCSCLAAISLSPQVGPQSDTASFCTDAQV